MPQPVSALAPSPPIRHGYARGDLFVGKYRLERLLGRGGMGEVWEATNVVLDAPCAIKLIRAEFEVSSSKARLLQEAHSIAKLGHPGIVRVFDVGEVDGTDEPFIVMELLKGEPLRDVLLREGRLSAPLCVQTLLPIADALSTAHRSHLVHRDLKPDNVFLAEAGARRLQPKLFDFGVVKVERVTAERKLTQLGTLVGSPDYMSPEQARGADDVDHRTDIWAFCVMLYEILTGEMPFADVSYNALLRAIIEQKERPLEEFVVGDKGLNSIVHFGLHKDREHRWQTMEELGRALAEWLLRRGIHEDVAGKGLAARWTRPESGIGRTLDFTTTVRGRGWSAGEAPSPVCKKRSPLLVGGMLMLPLIGFGGLLLSGSGSTSPKLHPPTRPAAPTASQKPADVVKLAPPAAELSRAASDGVLPAGATKLQENHSPGPEATASVLGADTQAAPRLVGRRRAAAPKRRIAKARPSAPPFDLKVPY